MRQTDSCQMGVGDWVTEGEGINQKTVIENIWFMDMENDIGTD